MRDRFFEFFDAEYVLVVRFLMRCGASLHDAEDAAQEAFADAWVQMGRDGKWADVAEPRGWIRRVALRKYRRPPGRRPRLQTVPVADVPELQHHDIGNDDVAAAVGRSEASVLYHFAPTVSVQLHAVSVPVTLMKTFAETTLIESPAAPTSVTLPALLAGSLAATPVTVPRHGEGTVALVDRSSRVLPDPKAVSTTIGVLRSSSPEAESKKPCAASAAALVSWLTVTPPRGI